MKIDHTWNVADHAKQVAAELHLSEQKQNLVYIMGLLHDVGRFPQYAVWHTFSDFHSTNHASLSVKVIQELSFLYELPMCEWHQIATAVFYHNVFQLPTHLSNQDELYCKLLRDADKMDIFRVIIENPGGVIRNENNSFEPSQKIWSSINSEQCCFYEDIQTDADRLLLQLSWVYDIHYPCTQKYLLQSGTLDRFFALLPKDIQNEPKIQKVKAYAEEVALQAK